MSAGWSQASRCWPTCLPLTSWWRHMSISCHSCLTCLMTAPRWGRLVNNYRSVPTTSCTHWLTRICALILLVTWCYISRLLTYLHATYTREEQSLFQLVSSFSRSRDEPEILLGVILLDTEKALCVHGVAGRYSLNSGKEFSALSLLVRYEEEHQACKQVYHLTPTTMRHCLTPNQPSCCTQRLQRLQTAKVTFKHTRFAVSWSYVLIRNHAI